ncbi:TetR/AcrR family transcriptional regulator [Prolixibacteraceae bacterium JC049]|nr:TetR/AcrR family transcriptional regulator [Prolixibacteraceae bacterium JC049]
MARAIDTTKLERVKETAMELIVDRGYGGASISMIAKKAAVAEGYLYRFYGSKLDLVNDLLFEQMKSLLEIIEDLFHRYDTINEILSGVIKELFKRGEANPTHVKFVYVLVHDYSFRLKEEQRNSIFEVSERIKNLGVENGEIRNSVSEEEVFIMFLMHPVQYMNFRFKGLFHKTGWEEKDIENVIEFGLNALK